MSMPNLMLYFVSVVLCNYILQPLVCHLISKHMFGERSNIVKTLRNYLANIHDGKKSIR
jgi:hypothetical protein